MKNFKVLLIVVVAVAISATLTKTILTSPYINSSTVAVTANSTDLNKLSGLATTKTELGYLSGTTSNIQTQLNTKVSIDSLQSATDEFYNKTQSNARFINEDGDTITGVINVPTPAAGTNTTQVVNANFVNLEKSIQANFKAMNWPVKTIPFGYRLYHNATATDLVSGTIYLVLQDPIYENKTITSIKGISSQQGAFTDDGSIAGIYTFSGGTLTKVAETTNIGDELKKSAGSTTTFTLTSQYNAVAGSTLYYAVLYKYVTTQTTAPRLYNGGTVSGMYNMLTGGATTSLPKVFGTLAGQTSLPNTISISSVAQGTYPLTLCGF